MRGVRAVKGERAVQMWLDDGALVVKHDSMAVKWRYSDGGSDQQPVDQQPD